MKKQKFLRTDSHKYSKLGVRRKKKQKYRKAKGIDNKIRLNMKGHLKKVKVGFRNKKKIRGLIKGLKPILIYNIENLKNIKKEEIGIVAKIGRKKKVDIAEYALKNNIKLLNLNPKNFLQNNEFKLKESKQKKEERNKKKRLRDKKKKERIEKEEAEKKESKEKTIENIVKDKNKQTNSNISRDKKEKEEMNIDKLEIENIKKQKDNKKQKSKKLEDNKKQIQTNNYGRGK